MRQNALKSGSARSYQVRILGTGGYLPGRRVSSAQLDIDHDRPPGTTEARSGVRERRWADESETSSRMGAAALRSALDGADMAAGDLSAVIGCSVLPEQPMPTNAPQILGNRHTNGATTNSGMHQNMWWICKNKGAVLLNSTALMPVLNRR